MYVELLRFARRRADVQVDEAVDPALSDPRIARDEFLALPVPKTEMKCLELLEGYYEILRDFRQPEIAEHYKNEVRGFVEDHNLRYTVSEACKFVLTIPGLLLSQYSKLQHDVTDRSNLSQALVYLEGSASRLRNISDEERNAIRLASNLLESIACAVTINGQNTLNRSVDGCDVFPHAALRACIKNFYSFASDYPNIRHAGNLASSLRDLKKDDALLAIAFAVAFGNYVLNNNAASDVLLGEL